MTPTCRRCVLFTYSLLGEALLGQEKYAESEPLLLMGYLEMKELEKTIPTQAKTLFPDALDRLIKLYTETSKLDEAMKWQTIKDVLTKPAEKQN